MTLPEDCVVLEIVGQAATAGNDLEIPVVVRQIPAGPQPVLLDDTLEVSPALQLLTAATTRGGDRGCCSQGNHSALRMRACHWTPKEKLESASMLEPRGGHGAGERPRGLNPPVAQC